MTVCSFISENYGGLSVTSLLHVPTSLWLSEMDYGWTHHHSSLGAKLNFCAVHSQLQWGLIALLCMNQFLKLFFNFHWFWQAGQALWQIKPEGCYVTEEVRKTFLSDEWKLDPRPLLGGSVGKGSHEFLPDFESCFYVAKSLKCYWSLITFGAFSP